MDPGEGYECVSNERCVSLVIPAERPRLSSYLLSYRSIDKVGNCRIGPPIRTDKGQGAVERTLAGTRERETKEGGPESAVFDRSRWKEARVRGRMIARFSTGDCPKCQ